MGVHGRWLATRFLALAALIAVGGALLLTALDLAVWARRVAGSSTSILALAGAVGLGLADRVGLLLPLATVLALLGTVGRAAAQRELLAQAAAGVSPRRSAGATLAAVVLVGLLALGNQLWLAPASRWASVQATWRADLRAGEELVRVGEDGWRWCLGAWDPVARAGARARLLGPPGSDLLVSAASARHDAEGWTFERGQALDVRTGALTRFERWSAAGWTLAPVTSAAPATSAPPSTPTAPLPRDPPEALGRRGRTLSELGVGALLAARAAAAPTTRPAADAELWGRLALALVPIAMAAAALPAALAVDRRRWPRAVAWTTALCWATYALIAVARAGAHAGAGWACLLLAGVAGGLGLAWSDPGPGKT